MNAIYLLTYHILIRSKFYGYMGNYFDTYYLKFKKYEDLLIAPLIGVQKFLYSPDYRIILAKVKLINQLFDIIFGHGNIKEPMWRDRDITK